MVLEALHKGLISGGQPAHKLKEQPALVKRLSDYNRSVRQIPRLGIRVRAITFSVVKTSAAIRLQAGLMTNDSVTVALMRQRGVTAIATYDADLDNIAGLRVYQPGDIP